MSEVYVLQDKLSGISGYQIVYNRSYNNAIIIHFQKNSQ